MHPSLLPVSRREHLWFGNGSIHSLEGLWGLTTIYFWLGANDSIFELSSSHRE
jgi:hypothetical protein